MKNRPPYLLIISIISLALAALLFFLFLPSDDHRRFDFIQRFDEAEKTGFDNGEMIDTYLPDRVFIFDHRFLAKNAAALFSGDDFITLKNKSSSAFNRQVIGDGGLRLSFTDMSKLRNDFAFRIKNKNNHDFWKINLSAASGTGNIAIKKVTGGETADVASFEYRLKPGGKNALTCLFFDDYLILFNEKDILFQKKCTSLEGSGEITLNATSNNDTTPRYTVKLAEVPRKAKEILLISMTERFALVREHQIDITGRKRIWNVLSNRKYLKLENGNNPFLRRLKRKLETRPVIYFPMNSSLKYDLTFPEKPILTFALAAVPKYINDKKRIIFSARVQSSDSGKIEEVDITLNNLANGIDRFNRFGYRLDEFTG